MLKDITLWGSDIHVCFTWEERWKKELLVLREKSFVSHAEAQTWGKLLLDFQCFCFIFFFYF